MSPAVKSARAYSTLFIFIFILIKLLTASQTVAQSATITLPGGFADEIVVAGLFAPRAFTFTPDGRILVLERGSAASNDQNLASVRVFKNGSLLPTRALTLSTCGDSERGALGIALDTNFSNNGYLYIYYTRQSTSGAACGYNTYTNGVPGPRNRISRFTMNGDTISPASERILVDHIVTDVGYHNAGDLQVSSDGYLYATTGDGGISSLAPDTGTLNGKLLRILPTAGDAGGYTTPGNPFDSAAGAHYCGRTPPETANGPCREVFAYGLRNPFRFTLQPGTNIPFVGDVGAGVWEEIDQITPGGNYGWPQREGPCPNGTFCNPPYTQPAGLINPIYAYAHNVINANVDSAVIGGAFYTGSSYPSEYANSYFFAEFLRGFIRQLTYNSSSGTWTARTQDFASNTSAIVGLKTGLNGDLYYLTFNSDSSRVDTIHRIRYVAAQNIPPTAQVSIVSSGTSSDPTFTFSAQGSNDPDGNVPLSYTWNFGDGSAPVTTSNLTISHTYTMTANATVTLTVRDSLGATSAPASVTVYPTNTPATGEIVLTNLTSANRSTTYYAGDSWEYRVANAVDPDGPPLSDSAYNWSVEFHHREHSHPFLPSLSGSSGTFSIPTSGETDPVVWYRVILRITDARGAVTTIERDIQPMTSQITLVTNPAGGQITLEGGNFPAPYSITRVVGLSIDIGVPSPQTIESVSYQFANWSDGGAPTHTIVVPPTNTTYTANLTSANPTITLTHTPVPGGQTITLQVNGGSSGTNSTSYTGLRFNNVAIPRNAVITSASLDFYSVQLQWISLSIQVAADASDNSAAFTTASRPGTRTLTTARLNHSSNLQWNTSTWYRLGDVRTLVQEVVNRPNWQSGSSLSLILHGTSTGAWSRKFAASFERGGGFAPRLVITYTVSGSSPTVTFTPPVPATNTPTPTRTPTHTPTTSPINTPTFTPTPTPVPSGMLTAQIASGADDVNEVNSTLASSEITLWLGNASSATTSFTGLRFNNIVVPRGATITSARLEFYSTQSQRISVSLQMAADAADSSQPFTATNRPGVRTVTTARVNHTSNTSWNANAWYALDDIRVLVQEVINRPNWQSGNSLSIILRGTGGAWGRKFFRSFEGGAAFAVRLVITYTS
jgi:glucose/arabinose dehydrogenase